MVKAEVLKVVKEEIRTISRVFELHCKDEDITERELCVYRDYAIGKLTTAVNIWTSLEMEYLMEEGKHEISLIRAKEIRELEEDLSDNIRAMFEKKMNELK